MAIAIMVETVIEMVVAAAAAVTTLDVHVMVEYADEMIKNHLVRLHDH